MMKQSNMKCCAAVLGFTFVVSVMSGCSSRMQTRVVSEDFPSNPAIVQPQESLEASNTVGERPDAINKYRENESLSSIDIPVEPPPQAVHRQGSAQPIFAQPQEESGGQISSLPSQDSFAFMEETAHEERPLEVAKLAPSAVTIPYDAEKETHLESLTDVYFDYDRFRLRDEDFSKLATNAELFVSSFSGRQLILEGHCDARGTESYNMILGKRRARTVKEFLIDLGVPEDHVSVVSFGKDKPFCTQQTMQCWQENRRVHFVIQ